MLAYTDISKTHPVVVRPVDHSCIAIMRSLALEHGLFSPLPHTIPRAFPDPAPDQTQATL